MQYVALVTWLITAALGFVMLATWIRNGGARDTSGQVSHFRPPVVFGHFLLAVAGLVVWLVYLANDSTALAWVAFVVLLVVAGIGDTLVLRWHKDRNAVGGGQGGPAARSRTGTAPAAGSDTLLGRAAGHDVTLAEQRIPTPVVAAHGVFAVATVVLVLLTALGIGS